MANTTAANSDSKMGESLRRPCVREWVEKNAKVEEHCRHQAAKAEKDPKRRGALKKQVGIHFFDNDRYDTRHRTVIQWTSQFKASVTDHLSKGVNAREFDIDAIDQVVEYGLHRTDRSPYAFFNWAANMPTEFWSAQGEKLTEQYRQIMDEYSQDQARRHRNSNDWWMLFANVEAFRELGLSSFVSFDDYVEQKAQQAYGDSCPEKVDLIMLCAQQGLSGRQALIRKLANIEPASRNNAAAYVLGCLENLMRDVDRLVDGRTTAPKSVKDMGPLAETLHLSLVHQSRHEVVQTYLSDDQLEGHWETLPDQLRQQIHKPGQDEASRRRFLENLIEQVVSLKKSKAKKNQPNQPRIDLKAHLGNIHELYERTKDEPDLELLAREYLPEIFDNRTRLIVSELIEGKTNKQIATLLHCSVDSVNQSIVELSDALHKAFAHIPFKDIANDIYSF